MSVKTAQADRRQLEDARQPQGATPNCWTASLGGAARSWPTSRSACRSRTCPRPPSRWPAATPLGRAGLLGARAGRLHRRGLGGDAAPSSVAATPSSVIPSGAPTSPRATQLVADKAKAALARGMTPIVCVGETLARARSRRNRRRSSSASCRAVIHALGALRRRDRGRLRAGLGDRHRPHAPRPSRRRPCMRCCARSCTPRRRVPTACRSSTAAASSPTTPRRCSRKPDIDGGAGRRRVVEGRRLRRHLPRRAAEHSRASSEKDTCKSG